MISAFGCLLSSLFFVIFFFFSYSNVASVWRGERIKRQERGAGEEFRVERRTEQDRRSEEQSREENQEHDSY